MSSGSSLSQSSDNNSSRVSLSVYNNGNNNKIKRKPAASASATTTSLLEFKDQISSELPQNRRNEIYEYVKLFGYKPDSTTTY
jgi:hypothetical protein